MLSGDLPVPSVHRVTRDGDLLGVIVIDSTVVGRARGGLRMVADVSEHEIRCAARAMTLKYGLLGLPQGGAKAGIIGDAEVDAECRQRRLREFAKAARPLLEKRIYIPDADLGTTADDVRWMMRSIGLRVGPREWRATRSGDHTARSCLAAARTVLEREGGSLRGARIAIEGFGKVGASLARLLVERGATVVAISTARGALYRERGLDIARLLVRAAAFGSRFVEDEPDLVDRSLLLELPVDLLCPCARFHSVTLNNVDRVAAKVVVAGANDPVSPEAAQILFARGITYLPDFLSNCGGVLGGTLEFAGVPLATVDRFIDDVVSRRVRELLDTADRLGTNPRTLAEQEALARHAAIRAASARHRPLQRMVRAGIEAYHRRWIPEALVSRLAIRRLARGLQ